MRYECQKILMFRTDPIGLLTLDSRLNLSIDQKNLTDVMQWQDRNGGYKPLSQWQLNNAFAYGSPIHVDMPRAVQKFNYFGRAYWERKNITVTVRGVASNFVTVGDVLRAFVDNNKASSEVEDESGTCWQGMTEVGPGHYECRFGPSG